MADKYFDVRLEIKAPSKDFIDNMLDRMPHADRIYDEKIVDPDTPKLEARIRYEENWNGRGEHYIFENKWSNEEHWGLEVAFKLMDYKEEKGVLLNYQALTKIREWKKLGIPFYFC